MKKEAVLLHMGSRHLKRPPAPETAESQNCTPIPRLRGSKLHAETHRLWAVAGDGTLWALDLGTGNPLPGYPLQIIDPDNQNGHTVVYSSPTYGNGALYVTTGSQCDVAPYRGQVIRVNVGTHATDLPSPS